MSGKDLKDEHPANKYAKLITLSVFYLEISGKNSKEEQL